jgi:hypothetical protein
VACLTVYVVTLKSRGDASRDIGQEIYRSLAPYRALNNPTLKAALPRYSRKNSTAARVQSRQKSLNRRQLGVAHGGLDIPVAEIGLQGAGIVALIGHRMPFADSETARVESKPKAGITQLPQASAQASQQRRYIPNHWREITRNWIASSAKHRAQFTLSGAHSRAMSKIINFLAAVWASTFAITVGYVAHYVFDASIRTSALIGAAIFVLIFAVIFVIVPPDRFERQRKSK